ncbi:glycoside hydrolase family 72 protein [Microdochium trichocladiopsis]|uniref:1,3-beta-glucanosyltransferase n=1 Tax=Microdochium trichocladiopsis TaxID=1682393 RepID=A0A9P9BP07_9PEZI|nr:glycoside hydrolase family 72 protein [Microdochium trichocladiopsis]KAH7032634.1 glycoside hydrolase family 72 protein [Microdochium trichocladiopsis]
MKGTKFFYNNGTQFYVKGIAYQSEMGAASRAVVKRYGFEPDPTANIIDPLADAAQCQKDVPLLARLGTNVIRTYAIDPTKDHTACMKLLEQAGIYVLADLGHPAVSINRDSPAWNVQLYKRYTNVIDELGKFDNVLGFLSGNEVTNNNTNTDASAFVKAATRDAKAYIKAKMDKGHRWMGVGYASNDDAEIRAEMAQYFNCGKQENAIDFWGYNIYSWCGKSSFQQSGYDVQVQFFSNYSVPVFFAEYGCNTVGGAEGRLFEDTLAIYSKQMTDVFSGGIVFKFQQEKNDYGLVKAGQPMKNFKVLESQMKKIDPTVVQMDSYTPTNTPQACPNVGTNWKVTGSALPPTPNADLCTCAYNAAKCRQADKLDVEDYGAIFDYICKNDAAACAGIKADTETGVYGPYVMCNPKEQLAVVLDAYYANQKGRADACDFKGAAQLVSNPNAAPSCTAQLESASAAAAVAATGTAPSSNGGSTGNAAPRTVPTGGFMSGSTLAMGAWVLGSIAVGAGMVAL